jgi:hypothetical protein
MEKVTFRSALIDDLPDIVRMLADDFLGAQRELELARIEVERLTGGWK